MADNPVHLYPFHHRQTLPDCPRSPTPEKRSVEALHPLLVSIINGELKEGGLPDGIRDIDLPTETGATKEPGGGASSTQDSMTMTTTMSHMPRDDDPFFDAPFSSPPVVQCACHNCHSPPPPPFAFQPLPPVPSKKKTTPSPDAMARRRASDEPKASPVHPTPRPTSMEAGDGPASSGVRDNAVAPGTYDGHTVRCAPRVPSKSNWDSMPASSSGVAVAERQPSVEQFGIVMPYPGQRPAHPPTQPPMRPPRPSDSLDIRTFESLEGRTPAQLMRLHNQGNRDAAESSKGSVHSRRPSDPETASPLGSFKEALAEGTKAFVTTLSKRRDSEDKRRSVLSPNRRDSESETRSIYTYDLDLPPPTNNAKAVTLLGHHDRRHDRRVSDADEALMLPPPPRPFPGATSKAAALLGICVPEPTPVKGRFKKIRSSPRGTHASASSYSYGRRTEPTGWSGAGVTARRMSHYALQMSLDEEIDMDEDDDVVLGLSPTSPAPVSRTPTMQEEVTIAPGLGQSFPSISTQLAIHGPSDGSSSAGLVARRPPTPRGTAHPFAARALPQPPIRPEATVNGSNGSSWHSHNSTWTNGDYPQASTALQRKSTLKGRPPPISVEHVAPTRDYPVVVQDGTLTTSTIDNDSTLRPSSSTAEAPQDAPRLRSHILAKYRLIDPPIAVGNNIDNRASTCTTTSGTGTYADSSSEGNTRSSFVSGTSRDSYSTVTESEWRQSTMSEEGFGHTANSSMGLPSSSYPGMSGPTHDTSHNANAPLHRHGSTLTERLNRHVRNESTATAMSTSSTAMSAMSTVTATFRGAATATFARGVTGVLGSGDVVPDSDIKRAIRNVTAPPSPTLQALHDAPRGPTPWHNYNIRYDKDGREIPNLTPRVGGASASTSTAIMGSSSGSGMGPSPDGCWFEPATPVAPVERSGSLLRGRWIRR